MTSRERFLKVMNYEPVDRNLYGLWVGWWPETQQRWETEGYDPAVGHGFATDPVLWYGGWFFPNPPFEYEVVEETETIVTYINHEGILMRERKDNRYSSMPQFLRFPVETREDFRRFWATRMQPDLAARIGADYVAQLTALRDREAPLIVVADRWGGFFGGLRNMTGVERLCTLFYDDPAFVEEMMDATADFLIAVMDQILDYTDVDVFGFWEDMGFKTGPLLGPEMARQYMLPRYKRVVEHLMGRGVKLFSLDSDGDITKLLPIWVDSGINILYPFEVQCGMDVNAVRREFGRDLRLWCGIDKRALTLGPEAIDAELRRVRPLVEEGGYIPGLDHSMPPDISYSSFRYYMERLEELVNGRG
jgi:uroporphyrinogen decarboxylase